VKPKRTKRQPQEPTIDAESAKPEALPALGKRETGAVLRAPLQSLRSEGRRIEADAPQLTGLRAAAGSARFIGVPPIAAQPASPATPAKEPTKLAPERQSAKRLIGKEIARRLSAKELTGREKIGDVAEIICAWLVGLAERDETIPARSWNRVRNILNGNGDKNQRLWPPQIPKHKQNRPSLTR
jgi:hypothetical protein